MPGWCWWILTQGKIPTVKIGDTEVPIFPGRGMGWYLWMSALSKEASNKTDSDIIKKILVELEDLKRRIEDLEKKKE